jgi:trimethylamine---corrinoid protein Co-methyltransferase
MNGFKHVEPSDVITETAYLDMLFSNITLCDKPFMGSTDFSTKTPVFSRSSRVAI